MNLFPSARLLKKDRRGIRMLGRLWVAVVPFSRRLGYLFQRDVSRVGSCEIVALVCLLPRF